MIWITCEVKKPKSLTLYSIHLIRDRWRGYLYIYIYIYHHISTTTSTIRHPFGSPGWATNSLYIKLTVFPLYKEFGDLQFSLSLLCWFWQNWSELTRRYRHSCLILLNFRLKYCIISQLISPLLMEQYLQLTREAADSGRSLSTRMFRFSFLAKKINNWLYFCSSDGSEIKNKVKRKRRRKRKIDRY